MIEDPYRVLLKKLLKRLIMKLGNNLVSVVVYGSVARKTTRKNSDIDLLIIADSLPKSRMKRQELFLEIEKPLESMISDLWDKGFYMDFSPVILSVEEALKIRPIYLDMVEDAIIIYDKNGFFNFLIRF